MGERRDRTTQHSSLVDGEDGARRPLATGRPRNPTTGGTGRR